MTDENTTRIPDNREELIGLLEIANLKIKERDHRIEALLAMQEMLRGEIEMNRRELANKREHIFKLEDSLIKMI
jgi:hypothetical protein